MLNTIKKLPNGDFEVYYTDEQRRDLNKSALATLRKQKADATLKGQHSLAKSLDNEIAFLSEIS